MPIISLFFLLTIGMLSPTNFDNFFITKIKFELGSIIKGFFSTKFIRLEFFLLIKFNRLILPIYLFSSDTIYPSVVLDLVDYIIPTGDRRCSNITDDSLPMYTRVP